MPISARVTLIDGTIVDQVGEGIKDVGNLRLRIERLPSNKALYAASIENLGRVCWDSGGDWVTYSQFAIGMPDTWSPRYHPIDGTVKVAEAEGHCAWEVEGPAHARAVHGYYGSSRQPQIGHSLEGRQVLRVVFGEPNSELQPDTNGIAKLNKFLHGGVGGGGNVDLQRVISQWDMSIYSFNASIHPWTAGTWWLAAHGILSWTGWSPMIGARKLGATPSVDGPKAGSNARYWSILWLLANQTSSSMLMALNIARNVASSGWVHAGKSENYPRAHMTGLRRFEKSDGDFCGDSSWPTMIHNWTSDIQFAAAIFHDPLLERTADLARSKLLAESNIWNKRRDSRILDRWLEGLRAAWIITSDNKYAQHAELIVSQAFAQLAPGEDWFLYSDTNDVFTWEDGGVLFRITEWIDDGFCLQFKDKVLDMLRWQKNNYVRDDGACAHQGHLNTTTNTWSFVWRDWAENDANWFLPGFHWAVQYDSTFKPICKKVVSYWLSRRFNASTEWYAGNASEKTRGHEMLGCLRSGQIISDSLSW